MIYIGALIGLIAGNALLAGLTAGVVALINLIPGADFGFTIPAIFVCGIYTLIILAQLLIFAGTKRKIDKEFDKFTF